MSTLTPTILSTLRGSRESRPRLDLTLAGGLRSWLEDDLAPLVSDLSPAAPLRVTPRSVATPPRHLAAVPNLETLARAALVSALLPQLCVFGSIEHPMDDALSALEAEPRRAELVDIIHALDPDAFARLAAEVAAHAALLQRDLGQVPSTWLPRCNVQLGVALAGGRILFSAQPSLLMGPPATDVATLCCLDVTTSDLDDHTTTRLGLLALLETLRSGAAPLRVGALSTLTGATEVLPVTDDVLTTAVTVFIDTVRARQGEA